MLEWFLDVGFVVWSMADMYFGTSLSVFAALLGSLVACLGLCYSMVIIYDRFTLNSSNNNEKQEKEIQFVTESS